MEIDYTFKANLTTVLVTGLFPVLASYGVSEAVSNAIIGVLSYVICLVIALYGEKYVSTFLTEEPVEVNGEVGSDFETA